MSEEEIIKNIKKQIQWSDYNTYKMALQCLLDLYNKEKEERQYEKELRLKYERRYNSRTEENKKLKEKNINDCYKYGDNAQKAYYKKKALQELLEERN